jgi:hypothetical protein
MTHMRWSQKFNKCGIWLQRYDFLLLQSFLNKKKQQCFLIWFFALWFCRSFNSIIVMIVACICSIMSNYSLGIPQSTLALPQMKASLIVYVFPFVLLVLTWFKIVKLEIVYNFCFFLCSWFDIGSPLLTFLERGKQSKNY